MKLNVSDEAAMTKMSAQLQCLYAVARVLFRDEPIRDLFAAEVIMFRPESIGPMTAALDGALHG